MKSKASTSLDINNSWQNVPRHQEVQSNCEEAKRDEDGKEMQRMSSSISSASVGARDHGGPSGADHSQDFPQVHHLIGDVRLS